MADLQVSLDRLRLGLALMRLAKLEDNPIARTLHGKVVRAWDPMYGPHRNDRRYCTVKLAEHEAELWRTLAIPSLLHCTYTAVYVDPQDPTVEVRVSAQARPPKKATFNVQGGKRRLVRSEVHRYTNEGATPMARKTKTAAPVDELDDLDDIDLDDDDDEAEAAPVKETPAQKRKRLKAEAAAAAEDDEDDEDDEEDDEDEEEDEEPAPKKKAKAPAKAASKPAAKAKAKGGAVGRALPEGKFGVEQVAEMAGTSGRAVRIYCRTNDIEKAEGLGRYAWTEKQATALAKKIKAGSK